MLQACHNIQNLLIPFGYHVANQWLNSQNQIYLIFRKSSRDTVNIPNPSTGSFTVSVSNPVPAPMDIKVLDMDGKVILIKNPGNVADHYEMIDNQLSPGVYFIRISSGSAVKIEKLVVL
ncbi:MAG: T9SS type A sorting domain-containing protein [Bacteroidales bacterium]